LTAAARTLVEANGLNIRVLRRGDAGTDGPGGGGEDATADDSTTLGEGDTSDHEGDGSGGIGGGVGALWPKEELEGQLLARRIRRRAMQRGLSLKEAQRRFDAVPRAHSERVMDRIQLRRQSARLQRTVRKKQKRKVIVKQRK
jgi:hypothetical protein